MQWDHLNYMNEIANQMYYDCNDLIRRALFPQDKICQCIYMYILSAAVNNTLFDFSYQVNIIWHYLHKAHGTRLPHAVRACSTYKVLVILDACTIYIFMRFSFGDVRISSLRGNFDRSKSFVKHKNWGTCIKHIEIFHHWIFLFFYTLTSKIYVTIFCRWISKNDVNNRYRLKIL